MQCTPVSAPSCRMKRKKSNLCLNKTSLKQFRSPVFSIFLCLSRVCSKWLDRPLLHPVPDADAGDHVDVFRVLWDGSSDRRLLRCVGGGSQEQRGLLRRLPTSFTAPFCERRWCGKKVVGGQWETGETGLMWPKPPSCVGILVIYGYLNIAVFLSYAETLKRIPFFVWKPWFYYAPPFGTIKDLVLIYRAWWLWVLTKFKIAHIHEHE